MCYMASAYSDDLSLNAQAVALTVLYTICDAVLMPATTVTLNHRLHCKTQQRRHTGGLRL
jgi:hypothetical protein